MKTFFKCSLVLACLGVSTATTALGNELPYDLSLLRSAYGTTVASDDLFESPAFGHLSYSSGRPVETMVLEEMTDLPTEELENLSLHFQTAPLDSVAEIVGALFPRGTALPAFCTDFVATASRLDMSSESVESEINTKQSRSECRDMIRSTMFGAVSFLKTPVYVWRVENQLTGSMAVTVFVRSAIDGEHYLRYRFTVR